MCSAAGHSDVLALALLVVDAREQHVLLGAVTVSLLAAQFLVAGGFDMETNGGNWDADGI